MADSNVLFVPKQEYGAFIGTNLDQILQVHHGSRLHLTRICMDICDFPTIYGDYSRGYKTAAYRRATRYFLKHRAAIFKTQVVDDRPLEKLNQKLFTHYKVIYRNRVRPSCRLRGHCCSRHGSCFSA
ncbi:MAG: isochorismatase family protein [Sporolactobacillus sp.]